MTGRTGLRRARIHGLRAVSIVALALVWLTGPVAGAQAAAPDASVNDASNTSATTANLNGSVTPNGEETTAHFQYAPSGAAFCTTVGVSGASTSTPGQTFDASTPDSPVSAPISALTPSAEYCFALYASNASGSTTSDFVVFTAGVPDAATVAVERSGASTATIDSSVDPSGQATTFYVDYDTGGSQWCSSDGASGSPAHSTSGAAQALGFTDASFHSVSTDLSGLTGGTAYCAEVVAVNGSGSARGGQIDFTAGIPDVSTDDARSTGATTAVVTGTVNPVGQATTYYVDYDTTASTWCSTGGDSGSPAHTTSGSPQLLGATDAIDHTVSVNLAGLTPNGDYCAELVAQNASGTARGGQSGDFISGVPAARASSVVATGATTALERGTVNPTGQTTTYYAEWDTAGSGWCTSGGQTGSASFNNSGTAQTVTPSDVADHDVSVPIAGLSAGTAYCAGLVAVNGTATVHSNLVSLTAGVPVALTTRVASNGASTASVSGFVQPAGQSTTYYVDYDLAASQWCSSAGASGAPGATTSGSARTLAFTDSTFHAVSVALAGLTPGKTYCAEVVAHNGSGFGRGAPPAPFTAGAPSAVTGTATATGPTTEDVTGSVNPWTQPTTYDFVYAPANSPFCVSDGASGSPSATSVIPLGFSDATDHPVASSMTGLVAGATYCWATAATNPAGAARGQLRQFNAGLPVATASAATDVTATSAQLNGSVNPAGRSTDYTFAWDAASSEWCASAGASGSPARSTTAQPLGFTDTTVRPVSARIGGLIPAGAYCFDVSVSNSAGDSSSAVQSFTAAPPAAGVTAPDVETRAATGVKATALTLNAGVNAHGNEASYHFDYGTTAGYGRSTAELGAGSGNAPQTVSATVTGLTPATVYHFRVVATNAGGTTSGSDLTVSTSRVGGVKPGTIIVAATQRSPKRDTVRGVAVIPADRSTLQADLLWSRTGTKRSVVGRLVRKNLRHGAFSFKVRLTTKARRSLRNRKTLTVVLRTSIRSPGVKALVQQRKILMKR